MTTHHEQKLLVTGASGKLGQRVLHHLLYTLEVPAAQLIATTRDPAKLADLASAGVEVRAADFDAPETLASAFDGATRALLISTDTLDRPGHRLVQHRAALAAAEAAGVQHVVYTSMPAPDESPVLFAPDHAGTEAALAESRVAGWTVLRNHWYFENLFMTLPNLKASGTWYAATGDGRTADISRDDLARAAATALASDFSGNRTLTLSGGEALTTREIAAAVSEIIGQPIDVVDVSLDALTAGMIAAGLPAPFAAVFASFDQNQAEGHFGTVTGDYEALTGVKPTPLTTWLRDNAGALRAV